ncbi:hypothetical protein C8R45DRAFT_771471, partial [Mycena sanguinolenta]
FPSFPVFNAPGQTDAILRTSDGVDFYVHRVILSLMSPVFQTMFKLPQAGEPSLDPPVIGVQEKSASLDRALRFFYPGTQFSVGTLAEMREIIEILITKYDMQRLAASAQKHLERYVATAPIAIYVLACIHRWEDLARAAAKETLKLPLRAWDGDAPEGLNLIPSTTYHNLIRYHHRCGAAAQNTTRDFGWI